MPIGRIRRGEIFDTADLEQEEEIEFDLPEPAPEPPEDEQAEPWTSDKATFRERLRAYAKFLER